MSNYDSPGGWRQGAGGDAGACCTTPAPTLLAALAASFACCFLLVLVFLCMRFLHLRRTWSRQNIAQPLQGQGQAPQPKLGLDAATIALIPSFPYQRESSASAPAECAVCLSAVDDGETVRQIPACQHQFHQVCVDVWLMSNASCPVCRGKAEPAARADRPVASSAVVPLEILDEETASSSSSTSGAVPGQPRSLLGGRATGSGQETDLERQ